MILTGVCGALVGWYWQGCVGFGGMILTGECGALVGWYSQGSVGSWWDDTDRGVGGMILTGECGEFVGWYWQGSVGRWWDDTHRGNGSTDRKICRTATFSTTNLIYNDLRSKPGLRDDTPVIDRLRHDTALFSVNWSVNRVGTAQWTVSQSLL
jgi:hypothetical protein